jgi:hypothetical protein
MAPHALTCPRCGAPLPPRARLVVVQCTFCGASVVDGARVVHAADFRRAAKELGRGDDEGGARVEVGGVGYRILGRVGRGESSDVFLAERAQPATERVLVKVLRAAADADLLDREWEALAALSRSETPGADEALRRLTAPVRRGRVVSAGGTERRGLVFRARSGFVDTFDDVARAYPGGVDGRHAVWMWRRILEALSWVHRAGWAHGAVLPQHLVVHARDHGVLLVGWSCAARLDGDAPLPVVSPGARAYYPAALLAGAPPSAATDITMSARCVARLLGGSTERVPEAVPAPIARLVEARAAGRGSDDAGTDDAWALAKLVAGAAREAYGRPAYHAFPMPGWRV